LFVTLLEAIFKNALTSLVSEGLSCINGLSVRVHLENNGVFGHGKPLQFEVSFQNTSEKLFVLYGAEHVSFWTYWFRDSRQQLLWRAVRNNNFDRALHLTRETILNPGESFCQKTVIGSMGYRFVCYDAMKPSDHQVDMLKDGEYDLTIDIRLDAPADAWSKSNHWRGSVRTDPVPTKVVANAI
jgi:hypothetical protein